MPILAWAVACLVAVGAMGAGAEPEPAAGSGSAGPVPDDLAAALERLRLPGVRVNLDEWCVDVEARVCLREGLLELVACTKDTKEHESIVVTEAKASHIHIALLLLGATPGNPAMRKPVDGEGRRFVDLPPLGGLVDVLLVFGEGGKERPVSEFIVAARNMEGGPEPAGAEEGGKFPTHTFLFAGSILLDEAEGPRRYLCDESGNLISLATFGDELLCLPGVHAHANAELMWEVDGGKLPEVGSKVVLRLRPQGGRPRRPAEAAPGRGPGAPR